MRSLKLWLFLAAGGFFVLLAGVIFLVFAKPIGQAIFGSSFAEKQAEEYVSKLFGNEVSNISCRNRDTDDDGYVTCDFRTNASQKIHSIECAAWGMSGILNRGCKSRTTLDELR